MLFYTRFLQENIKDFKNMWKGIKKIMPSNNFNHIFPTAITVNNETITKPFDIANAFNIYFAKVAVDIQSSIRFSMEKYYDYLPPLNLESFFITLIDSAKKKISIKIFITQTYKTKKNYNHQVLFHISSTWENGKKIKTI